MMKKFTVPDFQARLGKVISEIEQSSQIELVVLIKPSSAKYEDVPLSMGANLSILAFTYLLIADSQFDDFIVYLITLSAFGLGMMLGLLMPALRRLLVTKKRQQRNVEIMARALFQKGGLQYTSTQIGTLIYISILEQMVYIVADRGAQMALPQQEWQQIQTDLQSIFSSHKPAESLLQELEKAKQIFTRYIPALENNVNELPNNLQIEL